MLTKPIIVLISIISGFLSTLLFSIVVPWLNTAGECTQSRNEFAPGGYLETCESLIGVSIPTWWRVSADTAIPMSLIFGLFFASVVALFLLLRLQSATATNKEYKKEED